LRHVGSARAARRKQLPYPLAVFSMVEGNHHEPEWRRAIKLAAKIKESREELRANIRDLRTGLSQLREHHRATRDLQLAAQRTLATLSNRQLEVLRRVARGQLNKAIAFDLGISEKTVETHRARIMEKLGAESLADVVRICLIAGVTPLNGEKKMAIPSRTKHPIGTREVVA
jgi:DNA-binding NarL/FixJ family response regulator